MKKAADLLEELYTDIPKLGFEDLSKKAEELISENNLSSEAKWSLMYAKKYFD
jgi:hypothetical protein